MGKKKVLIIISATLAVFLAFGLVYYFGYFTTAPEPVIEPEPVAPPVSETEEPPVETPEGNEFKTLAFTEEEMNSSLSKATALVAEADLPTKIDYARVSLVEDKMFLSIRAEALGKKLEADDVEVSFQGTEISASGEANVDDNVIPFSSRARVILSGGKLAVDIETIKIGGMPVPRLYREKFNRDINQQLAELPFPLPLQELEAITIEEGKLIITGR